MTSEKAWQSEMPINARALQRHVSGADIAAFMAAQAELEASVRQLAEAVTRASRMANLTTQASTVAQLLRLQEQVVDALAPIEQLRAQVAEAIAPTIAYQEIFNRLLVPSTSPFADLVQSVQLAIRETTRLDEVLAMMSRLAAPEIERLVGSRLEEWRAAGIWEPTSEEQIDGDRIEVTPGAGADNLGILHESLTNVIVEQSNLTTDTEAQLASLLALIALTTGNWFLGLFFVLDLLRQREVMRRASTVILQESDRDWVVTLEWDDEGQAWATFVPALNNISTFGDTREEALERTHEAIRGYLKAAAKRGIPIPDEESREQHAHLLRKPRVQPSPA